VAYGVTSLRAHAATAEELLGYSRGHWGVENRLFWARDVTFGEDASRVRTGGAPEVLAGLRNCAVGLLRLRGERNIAAALRTLAGHPDRALSLIGATPPAE
jgi:hypothetical protein